jgi:predicted nucleic acid-binding protein
LLSAELLKEYHSVLLRPKLLRLHGLSDQQVALFLTEITANAIWCKKISTLKEQPPDPGDCHLWQLLATEPSAVLVTGDRLLLENPPRENSVISPADCVGIFLVK